MNFFKPIPTNLFNSVRAVNQEEAIRARSRAHRLVGTLDSSENIPPNASSVLWGMYPGYVSTFYSPASLAVLLNPPVKPKLPHKANTPDENLLQIYKWDIPKDYFLDKVFRDFMQGNIVLEPVENEYDFDLIDLCDRAEVSGSISDLMQDEYLFKPIALPNRTWHFQSSFELENSVDSLVRLWNEGQKSIKSFVDLREISLRLKIVEGDVLLIGSYSPAVACLISLILCCFTMDKSVFIVLTFLFALCTGISSRWNNAYYIYLIRPFTVIPRLGVAVWICTLGIASPLDRGVEITSSPLPGIVRLGCSFVILLDIITGDVNQLINRIKSAKSYRVRRYLSETLILCESSHFTESGLSASVIGSDLFEEQGDGTHFVLVADVEGLLFELRSLKEGDLPELGISTKVLRSYSTKTFGTENYPKKNSTS